MPIGTRWGAHGDQSGGRGGTTQLIRFTDIGWLTAYFEKHIATNFDLKDLDTFTPNSWTSNVWIQTVNMAGCPDFLRGITRIIWCGRTINEAPGGRLTALMLALWQSRAHHGEVSVYHGTITRSRQPRFNGARGSSA